MSDLPSGWEWTTIGGVADIQLGRQRSPKNHSGPYMRPYLRSANVTWDGIDVSNVKEMNFEPAEAMKFELQPGDLLLNEASGSPNEVGKPAIWSGGIGGCCFQNTLLRVRATQVATSYLYWYCRWSALSGRFGEAGRGVNIRHLGKRGLASFPIPLPLLPEQERIVAAIEEHLSRLDAAEVSLSAARQRLTALEQRLRDEATEGEPARLSGLLKEPLRNGLSAPASSSGSIRVVTLTAVTKSQFVDAHTKLIEPGERSVDGLWMKPGDIFVQRSNTPELVGTAALYTGPDHWAIFPDLLIRVRSDETLIDPAYLEVVLRSTTLRRYFQRSAQGIAGSMPKISQPIVEAAAIPLPPFDQQQSLVRRLSDDLTVARRMAAEVERSAARLRTLRRAVLAAAFSGQLVPQDSEDEPASVLLERIRAERAAAVTTKRTRKAKAS